VTEEGQQLKRAVELLRSAENKLDVLNDVLWIADKVRPLAIRLDTLGEVKGMVREIRTFLCDLEVGR